MTRTTSVPCAAALVAAVAAGVVLGRTTAPAGGARLPAGPVLYADLRPPSPELPDDVAAADQAPPGGAG